MKTEIIYLHFNKGGASGFKKSFSQKIIKFWTRPKWYSFKPAKYCHTELQLYIDGRSFSARGFENEVGLRQINYTHPKRWDTVKIIVSIKTFETIKSNIFDIMQGRECIKGAYDYAVPFKKLCWHNKKWFCSEACAHALGIEKCNVYPDKLYNLVQKTRVFF